MGATEEKERAPSSCGASAAPDCQGFLGRLKSNLADLVTGMSSCTGMLASMANSSSLMESYLINITTDCGYDYDHIHDHDHEGGSGGSGGSSPSTASKAPSALMCINRLALLLLALVGIFLN